MIKERLSDYILNTIKENWDINALADYGTDNILKYSDVAKNILKIHTAFKKLDIHKGEKIALCGANSVHWALTYISIVSYGAVVVPILVDFSKEDIASIIKDSGSKFLFADKRIIEAIDENTLSLINKSFYLENFDTFVQKNTDNQKNEDSKNNKKENIFNDIEINDLTKDTFNLTIFENDTLATIIYTSGTTGFSKGVMLNHNSLAANIRFAIANMPVKANDHILSFLPLAHVFGCLFDFLFPFSKGACIYMLNAIPSPNILLKAFSEVKPNLILMVPLIIEKIYLKKILPTIEKPLISKLLKLPIVSSLLKSKIRNNLTEAFGGNFYELIIGGSALNADVEKFLMDIGFKFTVGYGMTECGPLISYGPWNKHVARSCGCIIDTLEVKIDAEKEGEVGEIMVRGENVMLGYYKNYKATADVLSKDGWLRTGDLGVLGENNRIFIRGRSKNMLLGASGQNIYPEEIESKLNTMPYIAESLVVQRDNKLHALIYLDNERVKAENLSNEDINKLIEKNRIEVNKVLPEFGRISGFTIQEEEFIKNPTKKIKRFLYK
ncbi:AMP-binding protein [Brachyspira murdochii]|uniref:AMP-dependent synthetase and ligase n=1 Tax=Brachyspira murdochii (strain ATCC 51284 / DSM 12563 / 56-150) TaxID=526224 RepID=D5U9C6_BRAM5|nr:AMP-binding protein [Brachyspira murdochii]ADG71299.1 AMP-dependent synthetase and ligase [Brachyspira murdochii DSM 12563]